MKSIFVFLSVILQVLFYAASAQCQWTQTSAPHDAWVTCLYHNGKNLIAGTNSYGVLLSTNNGIDWKAINDGFLDTIPIGSIVSDGSKLYAVTAFGAFVTSDTGKNWDAYSFYFPDMTCLIFMGRNIFSAGGGEEHFISTDYGNSWNSAVVNVANPSFFGVFSFGTLLFARAGGPNGLLVSKDSGAVWNSSGSNIYSVNCLAAIGTTLFAGVEQQVYFSIDSGVNWKMCNTVGPINEVRNVYSLLAIGKKLLAGTDRGVFFSLDNGANWIPIRTGLPDSSRIMSLVADGTYLYAGTYTTGIWRLPLSQLDDVSILNSDTENISLYPNPTTGIINISNFPENTSQLSITNILGKTIYEIANPNSSNFTIDLSNYAPGIYYARFSTGNAKITKKIILH